MAFGFFYDEEMTQPVGVDNNGTPLFHHNFFNGTAAQNSYLFSWFFGDPNIGQTLKSAIDGGDLVLQVKSSITQRSSSFGGQFLSKNQYISDNGYLYKAIDSGFLPEDTVLMQQVGTVQDANGLQIKCISKVHEPTELSMRLSYSEPWQPELTLGKELSGGAAIQIYFKWDNKVADEHYLPNLPQFALFFKDDYIVTSD